MKVFNFFLKKRKTANTRLNLQTNLISSLLFESSSLFSTLPLISQWPSQPNLSLARERHAPLFASVSNSTFLPFTWMLNFWRSVPCLWIIKLVNFFFGKKKKIEKRRLFFLDDETFRFLKIHNNNNNIHSITIIRKEYE